MSLPGLLAHLALTSAALVAIAIGLAAVLRLLRADAGASYRAARIALGASLLIPVIEFAAAANWLDFEFEPTSRLLDLGTADREEPRLATRRDASNAATAMLEGGLEPILRGPAAADSAQSPLAESAIPTASSPNPTGSRFDAIRAIFVRESTGAIAVVYLLGVLVAALRCFRRVRRTRSFLRRCEPVERARIEPFLAALSGPTPPEHLFVLSSDEIETPCCVGIFHPRIVLPRTDLGPDADAQRVGFAILHEMVHLERRDPAILAAQRALMVAFWFHPAVHWLSRVLDSLRELACDRAVVARTGRSKSYARALLDYATVDTTTPAVLDATAMFDRTRRRSLLRRRIEMLACDRPNVSKSKKVWIVAGSGSTVAALVAFQIVLGSALPAFADEKESLLAYCPPKPSAPPCETSTTPDNRDGRSDRPTKRKDLKSPKNKPASPEEKNERLRELLSSKRGAANDPATTFVSTGFSAPREESTLDPDVKRALIKTLLRDDHSTARSTAAAALAPFLREKEVKDAFMTALRDGRDSRLKITVLDELLKREALSDDARELFVRLFAMDNTEYQRISLTEALAPYANEPDARDALVETLLDEANEPMQLESALALSPHSSDSAVQAAMTRVLLKSGNEVTRLVVIDALAGQAAADEQVRKAFVEVLVRDNSAIARLRVADRLAENAADPNVRQAMLDALGSGVSTLIQSRLVDGLAPHVVEPDVKRGFITLLDRVSDEVVKLRLVSSLAGVADASRLAGDAPSAVPYLGGRESEARLVPIVGRP